MEKEASAFNKKIKERVLSKGEIFWKVILPRRKKDPWYGKWPPN